MSAAEREAEQRWPNGTFGGLSYPRSAVRAYMRGAFVAGAMWQAEQAADEIVALFPILAGVTDEAVEAGALALIRHVEGGRPARPVSAHARELARVVLEAVLGKEQTDASE